MYVLNVLMLYLTDIDYMIKHIACIINYMSYYQISIVFSNIHYRITYRISIVVLNIDHIMKYNPNLLNIS